MQQGLLEIGVDQLMADPSQPRKTFMADAIERLAASILARGVQQPLRVLRDEERKCWLILTGESRYRAARLAGLTHVPCIPVKDQLSEAERLADRLTENMVRADLPPMEEAAGIVRLKALLACNSKTLVEEYGFSGSAVTRAEALVSLPPDLQAMVGTGPGQVPPSTAYEISRLPDEQAQRKLAQAVAGGRLNRDRVQEAVRGTIGKRNVTPKASRLSCRLDGGVAYSLSSGQPLTWDEVLAALDKVRKEAKKLYENGKEVSELARSLRTS